jgi:uncharacterized membrane protein YkvA (DUF1232 family)
MPERCDYARSDRLKPRRSQAETLSSGSTPVMTRWRERARELRREVYALYLACRDPRAPWYAKAVAFGLVAYALSPIDLIPDFVPVLG